METNHPQNDKADTLKDSKNMQEKSDPQLTELKGFVDPKKTLSLRLKTAQKRRKKLKRNISKIIRAKNNCITCAHTVARFAESGFLFVNDL